MEFRLKTITPLWTGGIKKEADKLHESGIIGNIRWWYETIVRGLGGYACDPTHSSCNNKNHCISCELFGCTGWARKFRVEIKGEFVQEVRSKFGLTCLDSTHRHRGWFVHKGLESNDFSIKLIPLKKINSDEEKILKFLFKVLIERAGFGARNQLGYGIVDYLDEKERISLKIDNLPKFNNSNSPNFLPSIKNFFFCHNNVKTNRIEELLNIKCKLREAFRISPLFSIRHLNQISHFRHFVLGAASAISMCPTCFGNIRSDYNDPNSYFCFWENKNFPRKEAIQMERMASKISISRPFGFNNNFSIRIWGWLPSELPFNISRKDVLNKIQQVISCTNLIDLSDNIDFKSFLKNMGIKDA